MHELGKWIWFFLQLWEGRILDEQYWYPLRAADLTTFAVGRDPLRESSLAFKGTSVRGEKVTGGNVYYSLRQVQFYVRSYHIGEVYFSH